MCFVCGRRKSDECDCMTILTCPLCEGLIFGVNEERRDPCGRSRLSIPAQEWPMKSWRIKKELGMMNVQRFVEEAKQRKLAEAGLTLGRKPR